MLTIDINNQYFALDNSFSVRISFLNPVCFTDKIPGDAGLGITLPVNDINRWLLGAPERFEQYSEENSRKFSGCSIRFGGALLMSGSLVVTRATAESYLCWLQSELGVMGEALQQKKISDFTWPTAQTFPNAESYDDSTDSYGVKLVANNGFWDGLGKEIDDPLRGGKITKLQKEHLDNFNGDVNKPVSGQTILHETGNACVVSPFLYLRYVISESLRLNGWHINLNQMYTTGITESEGIQKNMMIYNNFSIVQAQLTTEQIVIQDYDYERQMTIDVDVKNITSTTWQLQPFNFKDLLPKISYKDFLLGIQNSLNYVFRFRSNGKVDIIDREAVSKSTAFDISAWSVNFWEKGERLSRRIKFDLHLDKDDMLMGGDFEDLTDRLSDFGAPVIDFTALQAIVNPRFGELRLVLYENKIYEYKWMTVAAEAENREEEQYDALGWTFVSTASQPYIYNPNNEHEEIINVNCTTLLKSIVTGQYMAVQKGNFEQMRSTYNSFSFRCLVNNHFTWPDGLNWTGLTGLFNTRWKNWARLWANRQEVEGEFQLPLYMLLTVAENITSKFRTEKGEFIIEEIETEFGLNMIGKTRIKGYKI